MSLFKGAVHKNYLEHLKYKWIKYIDPLAIFGTEKCETETNPNWKPASPGAPVSQSGQRANRAK